MTIYRASDRLARWALLLLGMLFLWLPAGRAAAATSAAAEPNAPAPLRSGLHRLGLLIARYYTYNNGRLPPMSSMSSLRSALAPYARDAAARHLLLNPTDSVYTPNPALSGKTLCGWPGWQQDVATWPASTRFIVLFTSPVGPSNKRWVCLLNGRVANIDGAAFAAFLSAEARFIEPAWKPDAQDWQSPNPWLRAMDALQTGDNGAASQYALATLAEYRGQRRPDYDRIVDEANQTLGIAALREGRVKDADRYLIASAKTPGSPQFDMFGPDMVLAHLLLIEGEKTTVIYYLDLVAKYWAHPPHALAGQGSGSRQQKIIAWKREILEGKIPPLNQNGYLHW